MKKTPSALKWLVEKRARLVHEANQLGLLAAELEQRQQKLQSQLAALDETIQLYDERIDPTKIAPVVAQSRHGKRGSVRQALLAHLAQHSPEWVSSVNLEMRLLAEFQFGFASFTERRLWRRNLLGASLRKLLKAGSIERRHDPGDSTCELGYWRLKQSETPRLADL